MADTTSYGDWVRDERFLSDYNAYQARYARQIRESDKVLIRFVRDIVSRHDASRGPLRVLDIGCFAGMLLTHLKRAFPDVSWSAATWRNRHCMPAK